MVHRPDGSYGTPEDPDQAMQAILDLEPRLQDEVARLDPRFVANIDSTNVEPDHWVRMIETIDAGYDDYDGFVITHGTDTMAYTASALSVAIGDLGKPVVITGAQIPSERIDSDAQRNFVNAVRVATLDLSGVYLVFDEEIIEGRKATKVSESKLNAFETVNDRVFGEIRTDIRFTGPIPPRHGRRPDFRPTFDPAVAVVTVVPGSLPGQISALTACGAKAIVVRGYGVGNIPSRLLSEVETAIRGGCPVVVATQCVEGSTDMEVYEVGRSALIAGAIQGRDFSLEYTVTRAMWVLGQGRIPTADDFD
jgi:L-asparaginase